MGQTTRGLLAEDLAGHSRSGSFQPICHHHVVNLEISTEAHCTKLRYLKYREDTAIDVSMFSVSVYRRIFNDFNLEKLDPSR